MAESCFVSFLFSFFFFDFGRRRVDATLSEWRGGGMERSKGLVITPGTPSVLFLVRINDDQLVCTPFLFSSFDFLFRSKSVEGEWLSNDWSHYSHIVLKKKWWWKKNKRKYLASRFLIPLFGGWLMCEWIAEQLGIHSITHGAATARVLSKLKSNFVHLLSSLF